MDRQEITRLYSDYSRDVYRLALSYLHSKHDAEDICQSVFLKLLEKNVTSRQGKGMAINMHCQCLQKSLGILLEKEYSGTGRQSGLCLP